jgi:hypothetical protein
MISEIIYLEAMTLHLYELEIGKVLLSFLWGNVDDLCVHVQDPASVAAQEAKPISRTQPQISFMFVPSETFYGEKRSHRLPVCQFSRPVMYGYRKKHFFVGGLKLQLLVTQLANRRTTKI